MVMTKMQIVLLCLGTIGCVLLILGYFIGFKHKIQLIAGVSKNDENIKDKKAFASLVGGNLIILGIIFCVGAIGIYVCPGCQVLIEIILLVSILITGIATFTKSKKHIG